MVQVSKETPTLNRFLHFFIQFSHEFQFSLSRSYGGKLIRSPSGMIFCGNSKVNLRMSDTTKCAHSNPMHVDLGSLKKHARSWLKLFSWVCKAFNEIILTSRQYPRADIS